MKKSYTHILVDKDINDDIKKIAKHYNWTKIELLRQLAKRELDKIKGEKK